jgi:pleiotropic regulator 1
MGSALANRVSKIIKPEWHRPWKLKNVIQGHRGWVRAITVDPTN